MEEPLRFIVLFTVLGIWKILYKTPVSFPVQKRPEGFGWDGDNETEITDNVLNILKRNCGIVWNCGTLVKK